MDLRGIAAGEHGEMGELHHRLRRPPHHLVGGGGGAAIDSSEEIPSQNLPEPPGEQRIVGRAEGDEEPEAGSEVAGLGGGHGGAAEEGEEVGGEGLGRRRRG